MTALLEAVLRWLDGRSGRFELDGPIVLRDGSAWLRIAPNEPPTWWREERMAQLG